MFRVSLRTQVVSEENNNFTGSDPCPDEQELKSYASGELASSRFGRIIGSHLEFCPSCRSRVEKIRKTEVAVDEAIKIFAQKLKRQQEKLVFERWRGPQPGAIWRTVPESDEELLGPMVIVIQVKESGSVSVAEISEDIAQAIHTDMVLEPQASGLRFRLMIRAGNVFETTADYLKTFAGQLPSALTNKVVEFCGSAENFDSEIPLTKYKFGRDPNGTVLMHRKGITSGMLVTQENDARQSFLDSSKQRCSYLSAEVITTSDEELSVAAKAIATAAQKARGVARAITKRSLRRKILALAAVLAVIVVGLKGSEILLDRSREHPNMKPGIAAERSITEAERVPMIADKVPVDAVKGKEVLKAAKSGDLGTLRRLVKNASLANFFDRETHTAPLHLAASRGDLAVVKFLLDKGARVDAQDKDWKTALILAATKGYRDMVELLLKRGANPTLSDTGGRTAVYWALANGHEEIAEILRSSVK